MPATFVDREQIERTPGADRTNSLAMITDYVPSAYLAHDQLHIRGGRQVSWLMDGVPVPNTNIAGNVGPRIDPKDVDYCIVRIVLYNISDFWYAGTCHESHLLSFSTRRPRLR